MPIDIGTASIAHNGWALPEGDIVFLQVLVSSVGISVPHIKIAVVVEEDHTTNLPYHGIVFSQHGAQTRVDYVVSATTINNTIEKINIEGGLQGYTCLATDLGKPTVPTAGGNITFSKVSNSTTLEEDLEEDPWECPVCYSPMKKRKGKFGMFWGCTNYPTCKATRQSDGTISTKTKYMMPKKTKQSSSHNIITKYSSEDKPLSTRAKGILEILEDE